MQGAQISAPHGRYSSAVDVLEALGTLLRFGRVHCAFCTQPIRIKIRAGAITVAKFEECLQRLEKIVQELEKGEVPLEKSLTLFEEGMQLSSACRKELEQAEGKVEILLKQNGKLQADRLSRLRKNFRAPLERFK